MQNSLVIIFHLNFILREKKITSAELKRIFSKKSYAFIRFKIILDLFFQEIMGLMNSSNSQSREIKRSTHWSRQFTRDEN